MCITIDIPEAQNLEFLFVPGILFLNCLENFPWTSEKLTPTFSNIFPFSCILYWPPPSINFFPLSQSLYVNKFELPSNYSISWQKTSCKVLNQFLANFFLVIGSINNLFALNFQIILLIPK